MLRQVQYVGLFFVLAGLLIAPANAFGQDYVIEYSEDFSSDPGWTTDQPDNYFWDSGTQSYYAATSNSGPCYTPSRFAYKLIQYDGNSLRLELDFQPIDLQWSAGVAFGLFDNNLMLYGASPPATPDAHYLHMHPGRSDAGRTIGFYARGNNGVAQAQNIGWNLIVDGTWYRSVIEYDTVTDTATLTITERDSTMYVDSVQLTGLGGLPPDLDYLGFARDPAGECCCGGSCSGYSCSSFATAYVDNIDFSEAAQWTTGPGLNDPRQYFGAAVDETGNIWALGGFNRTGGCCCGTGPVLDSIERLVFDGTTYHAQWELMPIVMPTPRLAHSVVILGGSFYVLGGYPGLGETLPLAQVDRYDILSGNWNSSSVPPLPEPTSFGAAITDPLGRIWTIGGYSQAGWENVAASVWIFDPAQPEAGWVMGPPLNQPRVHFACALDLEGRINVIDGATVGGVHVTTVERIDPCGSGSWAILDESPPGPTTLDDAAVLGADGHVYLAGGWISHRHTDRVVRLTSDSDTWEPWTPLTQARNAHNVVLGRDDHIYAIGGSIPGCNSTRSVEKLYIGPRVFDDCNRNGISDAADLACGASTDCNGNNVPDECDMASGASGDCNGNGTPDECETYLVDVPEPEPTPIGKNRFISVVPTGPGKQTALRVVFTDLPAEYALWNGRSMWVTDPRPVTEQGGSDADSPPPTFTVAHLSCQQDCRDWSAVGPIDVFGEAIVPGARYDVQAIDCGCNSADERAYSAPLALSTSAYGDVVGPFDNASCSWTAPDSVVGIPLDTVAVIGKFRNEPCAPRKARVDLMGVPPNPSCIDLKVTVGDYTATIDAFRGMPYPFAPSAADPCDALPCPNP